MTRSMHIVKVRPEYLKNILAGYKTSEVRYNDRDYQVGDIVELHELTSAGLRNIMTAGTYEITHIHSGLGMQENYVVLSFDKLFGTRRA